MNVHIYVRVCVIHFAYLHSFALERFSLDEIYNYIYHRLYFEMTIV